jgi:hypothetical protein
MAKKASATYKIAQWDIGESLRSHTVNYNDLNASLTSRGTKFPLFQFGLTRRRSEQVWIEELWGHPTSLAHGFPAFVGSGHAGILQRVGRSRFPIREMVGLAALQMMGARRDWHWSNSSSSATFGSNYFMNVARSPPS